MSEYDWLDVFEELVNHPWLWLVVETVKMPDMARFWLSDGWTELPFD